MRRKLLSLTAVLFFLFIYTGISAQGNFTGINNTVITLPCSQACTNLNFQVPHLKSDDDYQIVTIPYTPYPYTTFAGNELTALYADDLYSQSITLPFPICFYGAVYNQVVVGSNGLLTFDIANANCAGAYTITPIIPYDLGTICQQSGIYYPKASIMGAFSDLDPTTNASPAGRKIEWRFEGTAPFRRFIASWNRVGVYANLSCSLATPTTFQIVINESTSVVEVFFEQKICQDGSTGKAILGVQDWSRKKAVAAPGKNATMWTANNEGYRFIPSGATSRFVSSQLFLIDGITLISTATTATTTPGLLDIDFGSICPPSSPQQYIVKTIYSSCINPVESIIIDDTITLVRSVLNATTITTNTLCGTPSGTIEVTVPGGIGIPPYTFILNPGPGQIVQTGISPMTFSNLAQGVYTVMVTDATGNCTTTLTNITVNLTNDLSGTASSTATSCPTVNNGTITVTPNGGSAPYSYSLDGGTPVIAPAAYTFTSVAAGNHTVVISSGTCSINPISVTVLAGAALTTTVSTTDALCNGGATGIITIAQPTIGTPPYEYSLDGITWQSSNIFTGLAAGTYTAYYRESSGCQGSQPVTVGQPSALTATASTIPVVCNGQSNGTITIISGGGISPYQYSIDGGINWQSSNIFNVISGSYTITIRDANNCSTIQNITVTEPSALSASSINTTASCDGGNDGIINVTANGGNSGYQYSIDGINFQVSNLFNVGPGNYTVTVKDNLGCITSFPAIVTLRGNLTYTQQTDPTICEGKSIQLQLTSNATIYAWTPGTGLNSITVSNPVANPTITTQYIVTATLGRCSVNDTVIVNVNAAPIPDAGAAGFICYGQNYTLQGSGGVQYLWKPSTYLSNASAPNPVAAALKTTTYSLSIVADINGCASLVSDDVIVDVTPPVKVTTFPYDTIGYPMDQFQLNATSAATNYTWTPTTGLSNANIPNPVVTIGNIGDDVIYRVTASTNAGCKGEGFVRVRVYTGPDIYVPSAFTPNGDGKNDKFYPFPVGIKSINYFRVFNRWGQMVFSSTKLNDGWDGRLSGAEQPTGLFVWMAQALTKDNKVITKKGTVTLIR